MSVLTVLYGRLGSAANIPVPDISFYSDVPSSITSSGGIVSAWGAATSVTGSPLLITDTVTNKPAIRTGASDKLSLVNGAANFLSQTPNTVIIVSRSRKHNYGVSYPPIDTTAGGTTTGYQLSFDTLTTQTVFPRIYNGTSWLLDVDSAYGMFIEQKWSIHTVRTSTTTSDIRCDGQFLHIGGRSISLTFPLGTPSHLEIGKGPHDFFAIEIYSRYLTDLEVIAAEARLAARFNVDMLYVISGDPTLLTTNSSTFPYLSKLPGGKLYCTVYRGHDGPTASDTNEYLLSGDGGKTWSTAANLSTNGAVWYGDFHTSEPLSDGQVFQHWQLFNTSGVVQTKLQWRKSTGFNVDGSPIWGATQDLPVAGVDWVATGAAMVENPNTPGQYHIPAYALQTGHTKENIYDLKSTDSGSTWSVIKIADGDTDVRRYVEQNFMFTSTANEIYCRSRVQGGTTAFHTHSTDAGVTWAAMVDSSAQSLSSAQGDRILASGRYFGLGRMTFANQQTGTFWRAPGAGVLTTWTNSPGSSPMLDPFFGGNYYQGSYEVSPGNITAVFSRATGNVAINNVGVRTNLYEWYLTYSMPGDATPHTATVTASGTQQITATGAGDYVYNITSNPGGCSINATTGVFTAGTVNGVCTFTVADCNGQQLASCSYTVTGGSGAGLAPDQIDTTNLTAWWDPRRGITPDGGGHIASWTSSDTAARVLQAINILDVGTGLNGHTSIECNGVDAALAATVTHLSDLITSGSWTVFWVSKDIGSGGTVGHYYNAPALCDGGIGQFGCGTTTSTAFAGQGGTYTVLDEISQTGGVLHYYVAQYDSVAGKIYMSIDGGAFDVGTTTTAITDFTGGIRVIENPLVASFFKGSFGDLAVWKSKLTSGDITSLQTWAAARYA